VFACYTLAYRLQRPVDEFLNAPRRRIVTWLAFLRYIDKDRDKK